MADQAWPKDHYVHGENEWDHHVDQFLEVLRDSADINWWIVDHDLKYLEIRIDTRDNGFVLFDGSRNRISPDRVVNAIAQYKARFCDKSLPTAAEVRGIMAKPEQTS